ncbi:TetR family transcriptional regulator [Nocardioides sp. AN3]
MPEINDPPAASPVHDGRLQRGSTRRLQLVQAALRVIERDGVAGASMRSVAAEAQVSPALVIYHFDSVENLLAEALSSSTDAHLEGARTAVAAGTSPLDALATAIAESANTGGHLLVAEFQLYLKAVNDPRMVCAIEGWWSAVEKLLEPGVPNEAIRKALILSIDGMFLRQILPGHKMDRDEVLETLHLIAAT